MGFQKMIDIINKQISIHNGNITEYDYISEVTIVNVLLIHKAILQLLIKIH